MKKFSTNYIWVICLILGENSLEGELELRGGIYSFIPLDATAKLKFNQKKTGQYRSPFDPYEIEITISNTAFGDRMPRVNIGNERIKGNWLNRHYTICIQCNLSILFVLPILKLATNPHIYRYWGFWRGYQGNDQS